MIPFSYSLLYAIIAISSSDLNAKLSASSAASSLKDYFRFSTVLYYRGYLKSSIAPVPKYKVSKWFIICFGFSGFERCLPLIKVYSYASLFVNANYIWPPLRIVNSPWFFYTLTPPNMICGFSLSNFLPTFTGNFWRA